MALRSRIFSRAFNATRTRRAAGAGSGVEEEFNEPGGRLFGEAIRKPGERRKLYDWEVPYIGSLVIGGIMLAVGLNSRPDTSATVWAREEALARQAKVEAGSADEE